ncbi:MAG: hypothetical protein VB139_05625 [Coriobacteriia bacterium]|nr:hypothetical protein [Coriobacteriia bacterium]
MDERYYIIGALALVLVLLAVYVIASVVRYRRAVRRSRFPRVVADTEGEAKYLAEDDSIRAAFAAQPAQEPVVPEVETEPVVAPATPVPTVAPAVARPALEPESLDQPDEPRRVAVTADATPVTVAVPDIDELTRLMLSLEAPAPEPAPESAPAPEQSLPGYSLADELERLMGAATAESALLPPEAHARDAAPLDTTSRDEPAFEAPPLLPPLSLGQALSGTPATAAAPVPQPVIAPAPGPASPAPSVRPEAVASPPRPARPATVIAPVPPVGAAVSPASPRPTAVAAGLTDDPAGSVPEYGLVAPVELHFTGGQGRVGVKPGTRSYAEFQRLAGIMLGDLRAARER